MADYLFKVLCASSLVVDSSAAMETYATTPTPCTTAANAMTTVILYLCGMVLGLGKPIREQTLDPTAGVTISLTVFECV